MKMYLFPMFTMFTFLSTFGMGEHDKPAQHKPAQQEFCDQEALKAKTQAATHWGHLRDCIVVSAAFEETYRQAQSSLAVQAFGDYEAYKRAVTLQQQESR